MLTLREDLLLLSLEPLRRDPHLRILSLQQQRPQLIHEPRRVFLQKSGERDLDVSCVWEVRRLEHVEYVFHHYIILES